MCCGMAIDIALCSGRHFLPGLAVTVRSAIESATTPINVHVGTVGLTEADREKLRRSWYHPNCGTVTFKEIAAQTLKGFRPTAYLNSKIPYARYFLSEKFPDVGRCIFLDADLMVFRDLTEAFQTDLAGSIIAAVRDISARHNPTNTALKRRLGLRDERNYFNSGFMVVDLEMWRRERLADRLVELSVNRFDDLDSQDQDALNIALEDRVLLIDDIWNISQYEKPEPLNGRIVHLIGPIKPWDARYKQKFREAYYRDVIFQAFTEVLDRTEFRGSRPRDFPGLRTLAEWCAQKIPTGDMIIGKLRRIGVSAKRTGRDG
jgi:lipopolysaccharide biosynthesis glycosyltransferase